MVSFDEVRRGMQVKADIGQEMVDIRVVDVVDIDRDAERCTVSLGNGEMAGPYIVPATRIQEILRL